MADKARALKIADRIKTLVAESLQPVVKDPELGFVTITDVRVTPDLQNATVFYTVFGDETQRETTAALLERNRGRLRSVVGKGLGIRLTPTLEFIPDALPESAASIEEALRRTRERDAELAAARAGASYAGEEDPYRKPHEEEPEDVEAEVDDEDEGSGAVPAAGAAGLVTADTADPDVASTEYDETPDPALAGELDDARTDALERDLDR